VTRSGGPFALARRMGKRKTVRAGLRWWLPARFRRIPEAAKGVQLWPDEKAAWNAARRAWRDKAGTASVAAAEERAMQMMREAGR